MAPAAARGEKTPLEHGGNRSVCLVEGKQTATHCKQQRGEASPELQALTVTAPRAKTKSSRSLVERRMGLSGFRRQARFTSSKLLPENTKSMAEHIPAAAKPSGNPRAPGPGWKSSFHKESQQPSTLAFTWKAFPGADRKAKLAVTNTALPKPRGHLSPELSELMMSSLCTRVKRGALTLLLNNEGNEWREHKRFGEGWRKKQLFSPSALFDILARSHWKGREKPMKVVPSWKWNLGN